MAELSGTHPPSLYRLLRSLASVGVLEQIDSDHFASTPVARTLESDRPGTVRDFAMAELGQEHYSAWEGFPASIAAGKTAFTEKFSETPWEYYTKHPEHADVFDRAMTGLSQWTNSAIVAAYDFAPYRRIVDIGGGQGALLTAALRANPNASGILFDAPSVFAGVAPNSHSK